MRRDRAIPRVALAILAGIVMTAILAPVLAPASPTAITLTDRLESPSWDHWMGTDELGRDVFSRMLWGSRTSLLIGFAAGALSLAIGSILGGVAGTFGGWIDAIISRVIEIVLAFPFLVLLLVIIALIGPSAWSIIAALALTGWVSEARFVRGEVMKLRESEFALAARAAGAGTIRMMFRHHLPGLRRVRAQRRQRRCQCQRLVHGLRG